MNILVVERFNENYLRENIIFIGNNILAINLNDMNNLEYDEKIHDLIDRKFDQIFLSHVIIINDSDYELGFRIAHHLRFGYSRKPIFIIGDSSECEIIKKHPDSSRILSTIGTTYLLEEQINENLTNENIIELENGIEALFQIENFKPSFLDKIIIKETDKIGRHSIANLWGANRMAKVANVKISNHTSNALYFKYLLVQNSYLLAQNSDYEPSILKFSNVNNILLIDDNHSMGWQECLENIFDKSKVEACVSWDEVLQKSIESLITSGDHFDFILLDLYLDENDRDGKGKAVLKEIKKLNPVIPVIMFTASNKAWNMDDLYEAGADGYYVKEHPETSYDPKFSVKNFANFHKTVENCLEKGSLLMPYWKKIQEIKDNSISIINNKIDNNGNEQLNKGRINERLVMFLGLLKKAFEQTEFDKNTFFYSEWELAFMTLWSVLNEIQEAAFEKTQPEISLTDSSGRAYSHHTESNRHLPITYLNLPYLKHYQWKYLNNIFIEYEYILKENRFGRPERDAEGLYKLDFSQKSTLRYDTKSCAYSILSNSSTIKVNLENTLHTQIAFILLKMNSPSCLLDNLAKLNNEIRNKLYLTHGEDSSSPDFAKLYQEQRKGINWKKNIQQLFEIVYFLCNKKECDWNN